jgi:hypothetical protein
MLKIIKHAYNLLKTEARIGITQDRYNDQSRWFWLLLDFFTSPYFLIALVTVELIAIYFAIYF